MGAGEPDTTDTRENGDAPLRIRDPEEYSQSRRLQEIYDARQTLRDRRDEARVALAGGGVDPMAVRLAYRRVLKSYLLEIEPLMTEVFDDEGEEFWDGAELGTMVIHPPEEAVGDDGLYEPDVIEPGEPWSYQFEGVKTLVEMPSPIVVTFEWETATRIGDGHHSRTVRDEVPWHVMDAGYRATNRFLAKIGFEIEGGDDDRPYDDWRQEFENGDYQGEESVSLPHKDD